MYSLLNFEDVKFSGKLEGMKTIFTMFDSYSPSKYYESKLNAGSPARTQDTIYEVLRLYKGTSSLERFVAQTNKGYVSEYVSENSSVVTTLSLKKGVYEVKTASCDENDVIQTIKDPMAAKLSILLTLMPEILKDDEAKQIYDTMSDYLEWEPDSDDWIYNDHIADFAQLLNRFSTNFEMRYQYPEIVGGAAAIPQLKASDENFIYTFRQEDLKITPTSVFVGKPVKFIVSVSELKKEEKVKVKSSSFEGMYAYDSSRKYTEEEKNLIAKIPDKYVMPDFVPEICEYFKESSNFPAPMRVAYLIGPAGTGKTEAANAIFAGLGLVGGHYTCNPSTEIFDFIGQVFPNCSNDEDVSFDSIREKLGLPNTDDVVNDPETSYEKVFGVKPTTFPDEGKIIVEMMNRVIKYLSENANGKNFTYVESGLIKAARLGYGFEIQEIGCVLRPGVAVGLNALLETGGNAYITLPTGETIKKDPNCTFIFTSNDEYEGCVNLNQSVLDRMSLVYRIENPPEIVMKQRIMSRLNFPDEKILDRMIQVIYDLNDASKKKGITDGVCGYRSLENWCMSAMIKGKKDSFISDAIVYQSGIQTVLNKTSQKKEYIEELMSCLTCQFSSPNNI